MTVKAQQWVRLRVGPKLMHRSTWHRDAGNGSTSCGLLIGDRRFTTGEPNGPCCRLCAATTS